MQGLYEIHEAGWEVPDFETLHENVTEVVISNDNTSLHGHASEDIDTSFIPAEETRGEAEPLRMAGGSDKKPPFDSSDTHTTFEDPEENREDEPTKTLGIVATSSETIAAEEHLQASEKLEIINREDDSTVLINRAHTRPDLIEKVTSRIENDEPWAKVRIDTSRNREYFVDNPGDPTFFAKVTDYIDEPDGANELALAAKVQSVVGSDQAQRIAQEHGFSGIAYIEPLAMIDEPDIQQTIIYPRQDGSHPIDNETLPESERTTQLETLHDVAQNLRGLMGANGINPLDLDSFQLLVGNDNNLSLLDIEDYTTFQPAEATLAQGEILHVTENGQYDIGGTESGCVAINQGDFVLGRQYADGTGIQVTAATDNGYAVVIWNTETGESGFFTVNDPHEGREQITAVTDDIPSLTGPETVAHLIGPARVDEEDGTRYSRATELERALGIDDNISHVSSTHSQLSIIHSTAGNTVVFNTGHGMIEVFSEQSKRIYSFTPPTRIS
jgi:hypothetical protein